VWGFLALAEGFSMYQVDRSLGRPMSLAYELTIPLINNLMFALMTPFVFSAALRHPLQRGNWMRLSAIHAAGAVAFCLVHVVGRAFLYPVWDPRVNGLAYAVFNWHTGVFRLDWVLLDRLFIYNLVTDVFSIYLPILVIAQAVLYYQRFRDREIRASQLEGQLAKAHLQALKTQLHPHFLFNTLHSISSLMHTDVAAADKMITRLGDLLRQGLENTGVQVTTLKGELEFLDNYLAIEKVRFEDRLTVVTDVAPDTLDARVPHLVLQPLVENAVRHGISKKSAPGEIRIAASRGDGRLYLRVTDNGPGLREHPPRSGLGLRATRERLQTLYGENQSVGIRNTEEGGVEVCIWIPFSIESRPLGYDAAPQEAKPA
jgi:two-component system, LytTR family, sensor kinase